MLAFKITGIDFSYGARKLLKIGSLSAYFDERIGLVGPNGSGKSTLLDIIAGLADGHPGKVEAYLPISYFRQSGRPAMKPSGRMLSYFEASEGLANPSGGEETRLKLASAFTPGEGVLLLDEPTSDLDLDGIMLLREAISRWRGTVVLVTHDAALMSETCDRVISIQDASLSDFRGGYEEWTAHERSVKESAARRYEEYLAERRRLLEASRQMMARAHSVKETPSRMGRSEARLHRRSAGKISEKLARGAKAVISRLERLERVPRPMPDRELAMAFRRPSVDLPRFIVSINDLNLEVPGKPLLDGASFDLPTGTKTCLLGPNGCGKTTLVKLLADRKRGPVGKGIKLGAMSQDLTELDGESSALANCVSGGSLSDQSARTVLARLGIRGDMAFTPVGMMSGGERMKVALARLMLSDVDMLLLDEPTNHMDIESACALSEVLSAWPGTLLMVSHDRALIDAVSDRILIWEGTSLRCYEGNWSDYEQSKLMSDETVMRLASDLARAEEAYKATEKGDGITSIP